MKETTLAPAQQDRPEVAEARAAFGAAMGTLHPDNRVFVDESGIATNLMRLYGRAPRGQQAVGQAL